MKPVIGLTVSVQDDGSVSLLEAYSRAIENAGGMPILIPTRITEKYFWIL